MKKILVIGFALFLAQCNDSPDRQEVIKSLRALGVEHSILVSMPSVTGEIPKTIEVTVYAAAPIDSMVTVVPYIDEGSPNAFMLEEEGIEIQSGSEDYQDYEKLRIFTVKATLTVPGEEVLRTPIGVRAGIQVRYGFKLTTDEDEELIIGSFLVYPKGASELTWTNPTIDVLEPLDKAAIDRDGENTLKAEVVGNNGENMKMGWFATSGEIDNRRSRETTWEKVGEGSQTIIATIRGVKSRGFALKVVDVN